MPLHNEDEIGRPVSGTKIAEIVAPGVTALAQFKRLFVTMFANIRSLGVGNVTPPGPGNLHVENDLTVGGQIMATNALRSYFVFASNAIEAGNHSTALSAWRRIHPANLSGDGITIGRTIWDQPVLEAPAYRMLRDCEITGISAQITVDTPHTGTEPYVEITARVNGGPGTNRAQQMQGGMPMRIYMGPNPGTVGDTYILSPRGVGYHPDRFGPQWWIDSDPVRFHNVSTYSGARPNHWLFHSPRLYAGDLLTVNLKQGSTRQPGMPGYHMTGTPATIGGIVVYVEISDGWGGGGW